MARTTTITVAVYPNDIRRLNTMSDALGMSRSELVRRMIDAAYAQPGVVAITKQLAERQEDEDKSIGRTQP